MAIVAVGDSFTQGNCVSSNKNFMALIRKQHANTLNLGMSGEGPLLMLAALTEYLPAVKPKVVLWFFFEGNDFVELSKESKSPMLRQYVEGGFNQALVDRQAAVDGALIQYVEREMKRELAKRGEAGKGDGYADGSWYRIRALADVPRLSRLRAALGVLYGRAVGDPQDWYSQNQLDLFRTVLMRANQLAVEAGGTLYFVYLPARDRYVYGQDYHRESILAIVKRTGVPIVDVHDAFQREGDAMRFFPFGRFGHYNEEGNRLVAAEVLRSIRLKDDR
jgi:hypothetical protein